MKSKFDIKELKLAASVASTSTVTKTYTPRAGKHCFIEKFIATAPTETACCASLIWDKGGTQERLIWAIQGESKMPFEEKLKRHDGIRKLTLTLDNLSGGVATMSAYVKILEEV